MREGIGVRRARIAIVAMLAMMAAIASSPAVAQDAPATAVDSLSGPPFRFPTTATLKAIEGPAYTLILDEPFVYGWTGHVSAAVHNRALFGSVKFKEPALAEGQAVYGLPMGYGGGGGALFWCAPLKRKAGWWATCMRPGEKVTYSAFQNGLLVQQFSAGTAQGSDPVSVRPEAAPELVNGLRIKLYVGRWHKKYLEMSTIAFADDQRDGNGFWSNVARDPDGSARIAIAGGLLRFVERPDGGFTASILKEFVPGGSALVTSASP